MVMKFATLGLAAAGLLVGVSGSAFAQYQSVAAQPVYTGTQSGYTGSYGAAYPTPTANYTGRGMLPGYTPQYTYGTYGMSTNWGNSPRDQVPSYGTTYPSGYASGGMATAPLAGPQYSAGYTAKGQPSAYPAYPVR